MKKSLVFIAGMLISPLTLAENIQYGMVSLDASATENVTNDEMVTILEVFEDGTDPSKLTNLVNKKTTLLLDAVKHFGDITANTSSYNTHPIYNDGKLKSWQVSQQLTLETSNFEQMSQLIADINTLANIKSMQFRVSDKQAEIVKKELLKQAISNFREKAQEISSEFDYSNYKLVSLSVNGNNFSPMPVMEMQRAFAASADAKSVPAALSAGTNEVSVQVHGTIQLHE